jgi:hypothetical protein
MQNVPYLGLGVARGGYFSFSKYFLDHLHSKRITLPFFKLSKFDKILSVLNHPDSSQFRKSFLLLFQTYIILSLNLFLAIFFQIL